MSNKMCHKLHKLNRHLGLVREALQPLLVQPLRTDQLDDFLSVILVNFAEILQGALVALQMEIDFVPPVSGRAVPLQLIQEGEIFFGVLLGPLRHEQNLFKKCTHV